MSWVSSLTGRPLHPFDFVGHPEAERVIVTMGSSCQVVEEAVNYMVAQGEKVGLVKVRLYRPWSARKFLDVLPRSVQRIAVLDRVKEAGSEGEPLYLDVASTIQRQRQRGLSSDEGARDQGAATVVGGRYGVGGKDFTPTMVKAVYDNLAQALPKDGFTGEKGLFCGVFLGRRSLYTLTSVSTGINLILCM
jgi:pyruvate-ferredoxin/flavodoxin oxidoreductase